MPSPSRLPLPRRPMRGPALGKIHAIASIFPRQSTLTPFPQSRSKLSLKSPPTKNSKSSRPTRRHQLHIPARHLGEVWEGRRRPLGISGRWNDGSIRGGCCKRGISVRVAGRNPKRRFIRLGGLPSAPFPLPGAGHRQKRSPGRPICMSARPSPVLNDQS